MEVVCLEGWRETCTKDLMRDSKGRKWSLIFAGSGINKSSFKRDERINDTRWPVKINKRKPLSKDNGNENKFKYNYCALKQNGNEKQKNGS